jgi:pyruvate dehydrogenase E2 component (dihydrolipoamide acetyltransferase)
MGKSMDVLMPQLGETVAEGKISKWFVAAGDAVKPGDNLFEIETDKVSMEVPAITAGTLAEIRVSAGEVAPVGAVVAIIRGKGEKIAPAQTQAPLTPAKAGVQSRDKKELDSRLRGNERTATARPAVAMEPFREVRSPERNYGPARLAGGTVVTPLARRLAGEAGIDLSNVKGSGPHGRIVAHDVETARSAKSPSSVQVQASANIVFTADVEIARALALCAEANAAQKATLELADVIVKAWAMSLQRLMPAEESDIAIMIGKRRSLVRSAAQKSLTAISTMRHEPGPAGGTSHASTAISLTGVPGIISIAEPLHAPHTTLLGIGAAHRSAVEAAGSVKFVDMMTVTLTCDHQVVDSALGAELLSAFKGFVEQPVTMII